MARRSANLLLRVLGDGDDGRRMLASMKAEVREFGKQTASAVVDIKTHGRAELEGFKRELAAIAKTVTAEVKVDAPTTAIERLRAEIASVGKASRDTIIDVQIQAAEQHIERVRERLRRLSEQPHSPEIVLKIARASAELERFERRVDTLAARRADIEIPVHVEDAQARATIDRVRAEFAQFGRLSPATKLDLQIGEAETELTALRAHLDDLTARPATAEVRAQVTDAIADIERVQAHTDALKDQRAQIDIHVEDAQARAVIDRVHAELTEFGTLSPETKLDIQIAEAEGNVADIRARLNELATQRPTLEVRAQIAGAIAELDRAEAKAEHLNGQRVDLNVHVDESAVGIFARIGDAASRLLTSLGGGGGGGGLGDATVRVSAGFVSFGSIIGPLAAILAGLVVTIGVALIGALAALVASLATAAAAVGALGAALIAALGPGVALAIAVASRIAKVFAALKAQDAAAQQLGQKTAQGAGLAQAATDRQAAAAQGLQDANERLGEATTSAYREMADAAEAASDAVRDVGDAKLALEDTRLSVREAEFALKKLRGEAGATGSEFDATFKKFSTVNIDPSGMRAALADAAAAAGTGVDLGEEQELRLERAVLTVQQARQREKDAVDGVSDAERNRARSLATHNKFVREGIAASAGYQAALRGVRDAQRQVNEASKDPAVSAAQAKAIVLVGELTKREQQLLEKIREVRDELRGAFRGATDAVFGGMIRALGRVPQLINPLRGNFTQLGVAISRALDIFTRELIQPAWISAIRSFTDAGGRIAIIFTGDILVPFLRIVRDIALAALPALERGLQKVGTLLRGFSSNTGPRQLQGAINGIVSQLRSWLALTGQVARIFLAFVRGGASDGQKLVDTLTNGARSLANFLNSTQGQNKIHDFFAAVIPLALQFLRFLGLLTISVLKFAQDVSPTLATVLGLFNDLLSLVNRLGGIFKVAFSATPLAPLLSGLKLLKGEARNASNDVAAAVAQGAADVRRADNDLADAQRGAAQAQRDLTDARRTARATLDDLASSARNAELSRQDARLGLKEARDQLAADKAAGVSGDKLARSRLNVAQAEQRLRDATRDATRAKDASNEAQRKGIKHDDGVVAARKRLAEENKRVIDSETARTRTIEANAERIKKARAKEQEDDSVLGKIKSGVSKLAPLIPGGGLATLAANLFDPVKDAASNASSFVGDIVGQITSKADELGGRMIQTGRDFASKVGKGIAEKAGAIAGTAGRLLTGAVNRLDELGGRVIQAGRDLVLRLAGGIAGAGGTVASTVGRIVASAVDRIASLGGRFAKAGADIAGRLARGIVSGLAGLGKSFGNAIIGAVNFAIRKINKLIPDKVELRGLPDVGLPKNPIPLIPTMALGGLVRSATLAIVGEAGDEAVLPLDAATMRRLAGAIMEQLELPAPRITLTAPPAPVVAGRSVGGGPGGVHIAHQDVHLPPGPGGAIQDARHAAVQFADEMRRQS